MFPSKSTLMGIAWTLAALAVANRIPQARRLING